MLVRSRVGFTKCIFFTTGCAVHEDSSTALMHATEKEKDRERNLREGSRNLLCEVVDLLVEEVEVVVIVLCTELRFPQQLLRELALQRHHASSKPTNVYVDIYLSCSL